MGVYEGTHHEIMQANPSMGNALGIGVLESGGWVALSNRRILRKCPAGERIDDVDMSLE